MRCNIQPRSILIILLSCILSFSCAVHREFRGHRRIDREIRTSDLNNHFYGFCLYDLEYEQFIYTKNDHKFFTPASNIKTLTLLAALNTVKDSIPALKYTIKNDSLFFKGMGNPCFLNHDCEQYSIAFDLLNEWTGKLFYVPSMSKPKKYGAGWMWDDFPYTFQKEINDFPIYGNELYINEDTIRPTVFPIIIDSTSGMNSLSRKEFKNEFKVAISTTDSTPSLSHPFITSDSLTIKLLSDTLKKVITPYPYIGEMTIAYQPAMPVYKNMMINSNNFIAEQILIMISKTVSDTTHTGAVIDSMMNSHLSDIKKEIKWVDGSGLSRYNKITPRAMTKVLHEIYLNLGREKAFGLFPVGGVNGTLKHWYKNSPPFIIAKTGTMSGVHNLSGFLVGSSGKTYIFSLMNNNFAGSSSSVKVEMEKVLKFIHKQY